MFCSFAGRLAVWENRGVREAGAVGHGVLRDCVQRLQQPHEPGGRAEGDTTAGGGGRAVHRDPRGESAEGAQAQQYRHSARHHPHARHAHVRV